jgi:hypothetical protein
MRAGNSASAGDPPLPDAPPEPEPGFAVPPDPVAVAPPLPGLPPLPPPEPDDPIAPPLAWPPEALPLS